MKVSSVKSRDTKPIKESRDQIFWRQPRRSSSHLNVLIVKRGIPGERRTLTLMICLDFNLYTHIIYTCIPLSVIYTEGQSVKK